MNGTGHRPIHLRILSVAHRVAHRASGGRFGSVRAGEQAPRGRVLALITRLHRNLYRMTGGIIGGNSGGMATLLLTTTGRKTGQARTVPLPYFTDGDRFVVIGSNAGTTKHPAWYTNLLATPQVHLQVRFRKLRATAATATGDERARIWRTVVATAPMYAEYQTVAEREIPVVVLTPGG